MTAMTAAVPGPQLEAPPEPRFAPSSPVRLPQAGQVDVWLLDLEQSPPSPWELLSEPERTRGARLRLPAVQARFVSCRATVRLLLADYLGIPPSAVPLVQQCASCGDSDHGPLRLAGHDVSLSLSRSGSTALLAVGGVRLLGVDLELRQTRLPLAEMATTILSPDEQEQLAGLPEMQREDALLAAWVQKEAYAKALGIGLNRSPDTITVALPPRPFALLGEGPGWRLSDLSATGFRAALATRQPVSIRSLRLP